MNKMKNDLDFGTVVKSKMVYIFSELFLLLLLSQIINDLIKKKYNFE